MGIIVAVYFAVGTIIGFGSRAEFDDKEWLAALPILIAAWLPLLIALWLYSGFYRMKHRRWR